MDDVTWYEECENHCEDAANGMYVSVLLKLKEAYARGRQRGLDEATLILVEYADAHSGAGRDTPAQIVERNVRELEARIVKLKSK